MMRVQCSVSLWDDGETTINTDNATIVVVQRGSTGYR